MSNSPSNHLSSFASNHSSSFGFSEEISTASNEWSSASSDDATDAFLFPVLGAGVSGAYHQMMPPPLHLLLCDDDQQEEDNNDNQGKNKKRRGTKGVVYYNDENGEKKVLLPKFSLWYNIYVEYPDQGNPRFEKQFRRRFRMPYASYCQLLQLVQQSPLFVRWDVNKKDAVGNSPAPIQLLVLTLLRYMGRGWTFDDLSESTGISQEVIRCFFHVFIEFGSTTLFNMWVRQPSLVQETVDHTHEFTMAGLPGAVGSMDATHVCLERVRYGVRQAHLGFKLTTTARTYNLVVNHRRKILSTTDGHPSRWNDKTIVRFDLFVMGMKHGTTLQDFIFELYDYSSTGTEIIKCKYKGPWLIVDNGYHRWSVTIPPFKTTSSRKEIRFSKWIESVRKDVECTFGILKGRWRVLKTGIRIHGLRNADRIWKTCCAFHNWLLNIDGLHVRWEDGIPSYWEGIAGQHDDADMAAHLAAEDDNDNDMNVAARPQYDSSGMGAGNDRQPGSLDTENDDNEEDDDCNNAETDNMSSSGNNNTGEARAVQSLKFDEFRSKLVTHFDIAFSRREVKWPQRNQTRTTNEDGMTIEEDQEEQEQASSREEEDTHHH